jgi:hypothetical protein
MMDEKRRWNKKTEKTSVSVVWSPDDDVKRRRKEEKLLGVTGVYI